jgi:hypothetical protein|tara:strand:+ start:562 stop:753 length:192 start_codon:yes stop_codon:yes gene_type:complete
MLLTETAVSREVEAEPDTQYVEVVRWAYWMPQAGVKCYVFKGQPSPIAEAEPQPADARHSAVY